MSKGNNVVNTFCGAVPPETYDEMIATVIRGMCPKDMSDDIINNLKQQQNKKKGKANDEQR